MPAAAGAAKYYRRPKTRPRRTLRRNKFAGGEHIPGENPPGGENYVVPLEIKSHPKQLECRLNKSQNLDRQK